MVVYKVVAYGRWSLTRSGRHERVDCISLLIVLNSWSWVRIPFKPEFFSGFLFATAEVA